MSLTNKLSSNTCVCFKCVLYSNHFKSCFESCVKSCVGKTENQTQAFHQLKTQQEKTKKVTKNQFNNNLLSILPLSVIDIYTLIKKEVFNENALEFNEIAGGLSVSLDQTVKGVRRSLVPST